MFKSRVAAVKVSLYFTTVKALECVSRFAYEPAHDKTYNDLCDQQRLRSAFTSTKYAKGSRLSLFG